MAITGQGTIFIRNGSPIGEILDITISDKTRSIIDIVDLTAYQFKKYIGSLKQGGTVNLSLMFTRNNYELFDNDFLNDNPQWYEILLPDINNTTFSFEGLLIELPINIPIGDVISMDISIKVTGKLHITSGSSISFPSSNSEPSSISSSLEPSSSSSSSLEPSSSSSSSLEPSSSSSSSLEPSSSSSSSEALSYPLKIFPGAVGYGTNTFGAYAGSTTPTILIVDTLDSGNYSTGANRGTFMWACTRNYPRIIVFEVSGVIDYTGVSWRVQIETPYMNIYGQTAPGKGVTIKGATYWLQSTDLLLQHLRFKVGDNDHGSMPNTIDTLSFYHGAQRVVFDHCSFGWSIDENAGTKDTNSHLTFSYCFFAEPLDRSWHLEESTLLSERHAYNTLMYAGNTTFYRNLFAFSFGRNPLVRQAGNQIINNYIYACLYAGPMIENIGYQILADIIGNYVEPFGIDGNPIASAAEYAVYNVGSHLPSTRLHVNDNICKLKIDNPTYTDWDCVRANSLITQSISPVTDITEFDILPASQVKDYILDYAGAFYWNRDNTDQEVINKILANSTELRHSAYNYPATARNLQMTATSGNLQSGYNWATTNETLVISYNETAGGAILGPVTINLVQDCIDITEVVTYLNSLLPTGLEAVRSGAPTYPGNNVFIRTTHAANSSFIEVHSSGTANSTFGITAQQFYGKTYVSYDTDGQTHTLNIPVNPHSDSGDGFTNLQKWVHSLGNITITSSGQSQLPSSSSSSSVEPSSSSSSVEPSSGPFALHVSYTNIISFASSIHDRPSSNQWAVHIRLRNLINNNWDVLFGYSGYDGFLSLSRDGNMQYRDYSGNWYILNTFGTNDFIGSNWVDLVVISDGTGLHVSTQTKSQSIAVLTNPASPPLVTIGGGYPAQNSDVEIDYIAGWDLTTHGGLFDRTTILALIPDHEYLLEEGVGTTVNDNQGTLNGTINIDESGMWINE